MNLDNLNFTNIEESTITVSYPFQYDREKVLKIASENIVKLNPDYLSDFLPYTKNNFFGKYHLELNKETGKINKEKPAKVTLPCVIKNSSVNTIEFFKDNKIKTSIVEIEKMEVFFFEKDIAILTISYILPKNLSDTEYLYYHTKLSTIGKRSKQNIKTSNEHEFKYYHEFIDDLTSMYTNGSNNIFTRSNMYSYNLLVGQHCTESSNARSFLEPLTQYREKLDEFSVAKINANYIEQTSNINTVANENVVVHIGIKREEVDNSFISNEFFNKYNNNHFLTYIITVYQVSKLEQLINRAFLKEIDSQDLENMREVKYEMLHFISNGNFTKISNNSIRNNLYKFYRKSIDLKDMLEEVNTISEKITNKLEIIQNQESEKRETMINYLLGFIGIVLSVIGIVLSL